MFIRNCQLNEDKRFLKKLQMTMISLIFLLSEHFIQLRGLFDLVAQGVFPIPGITIESADEWIAQIEQEVRETIPDFNVTEEIEYVAQLIENYYESNDEGPVMW